MIFMMKMVMVELMKFLLIKMKIYLLKCKNWKQKTNKRPNKFLVIKK